LRLKRRSDTKLFHSLPEPTFFTDRDLGKIVPRILRENGLTVERYCDHFQEKSVADTEWLSFAARNQWIAISHDDNIRRDPITVSTIMKESGRLFIVRGVLSSAELADLFLGALQAVRSVIARSRDQAFIAVVRRRALPGGIMRPEVHVVLTSKKWKSAKGLR
jgi:PIN domain-containing protein